MKHQHSSFLQQSHLKTITELLTESQMDESPKSTTWQTEIIHDNLALDYSLSMAGSTVNKQMNGSRKQIDSFCDFNELELSVDSIKNTEQLNESEHQKLINKELKLEIYDLMNTNKLLKSENETLLKSNEASIEKVLQQQHLQLLYDQQLDINKHLKVQLQESEIKQLSTQGFYDRIQGQVKEIFKKQRDLLDENQNLHELLMKTQTEFNETRQKLKTLEKFNKLSPSVIQRQTTSPKKEILNFKSIQVDKVYRYPSIDSPIYDNQSPSRTRPYSTYATAKYSTNPTTRLNIQVNKFTENENDFTRKQDSRQTSVYQTKSPMPSERQSIGYFDL